MMDEIKVGDTVNYVPHYAHRFDHVLRNGSVELPWIMGLKTVKNGRELVEELEGVRLNQVLESYKKGMIQPPSELVPVRPNIAWTSTVTAVYPPDKESPHGHVDLDVHTERGFTLHYGAGKGSERIHIDHDLKKHHSCHAKDNPKCASLLQPDAQPLTDKASLSVVAALNEKVAALLAHQLELEKKLTEKDISWN